MAIPETEELGTKTRVSVTVTSDDTGGKDDDAVAATSGDEGDEATVDPLVAGVQGQSVKSIPSMLPDADQAVKPGLNIQTSKSNVNDKPPEKPASMGRYDLFTTAFAVDEDEGLKPLQFKGHASLFSSVVDSWMPTIIEKGAFKQSLKRIKKDEKNSIPILWQHRWDQIMGHSFHLDEDEIGLFIMAQLDDIQLGRDAAIQLKPNAVTGIPTLRKMSIGFESEAERFEKINDAWHRFISRLHLWETSLVTFAADSQAWVTEAASRMAGRPVASDAPLVMLARQLPGLDAYLAASADRCGDQDRQTMKSVVEMLCKLAVRGGGEKLLNLAKPESKAELLKRQLEALFATRVTDEVTRNVLVERVAKQARCAEEIINGILDGDRGDVTAERLSSFAVALGADVTELRRAAKCDGLELDVQVRGRVSDSALEMEQRVRDATIAHHELTYSGVSAS